MSNQNKSALDCAGAALLKIVIRQAQIAQKSSKTELNCTDIKTLLEKARQSLSEADPTEHPHKFLATKTALEVIEAIERGEPTLGGIKIFKNLVESINGGPRDWDFGGRPRQGQKQSVDQAFLRAAAVALWEYYPTERDNLVSQARNLIGVMTKDKLRKMVENFHARHDVDLANSKSPLSIHMPLVKDLIENYGYRHLKNFA
jgi:hypothetical protein